MVDRDDKVRYKRILQHALVRREKSRVLEAHVHSSLVHAEASNYRAHASPSSSSRRRQVSPTYASLPPSSRRRQVSLESLVIPEVSVPPQEPEGPHTDEPVSPQVDETIESESS